MTEREARTGARFAREKQVLRCAQNDNKNSNSNSNSKSKATATARARARSKGAVQDNYF
jgi:hypothetical protein